MAVELLSGKRGTYDLTGTDVIPQYFGLCA